ncbi:hypothetical protein M2451_002245 [Dysgonomonas sp. PFB1-18]|uniref:hypothetical protein n=1 Tax=unclassified Dysgonomonas TaxID=2630389 RepID=UPI002472F599|nr:MULTISPECIES: hypothetical protein [unclassified Dysgonomonas]MDH6309874.1 hypothetical protein [Dysgonomonas sp. PF1-14]MDH6339418.1 hypothetical protein [Dysgonomonas sp. PF1-16]MDH6380917.1 hypothetical protein [Dysgonomonas sp. PFB1-18]MDH6397926.1 hypothetical protein [Dysgonomonas sp. PF1-23]
MNIYINNKVLRPFVILVLVSLFGLNLTAQTPGGTGLTVELWLQSDKVQNTIPADGSDITQWLDRSTNGINFKQNAAQLVPRIKYAGMNYHPSLEFYTDVEEGSASTAERTRKLIAEAAMQISNTKSYYTFWVSVLEPGQSYSSATVFNYGGSTGDNDGWRNATANKNIWMENSSGGSYYHTTGIDKLYGIGTSIRPNDYLAANPVVLYHNGKAGTVATGRGRLSQGSNYPIIGNGNTSYNNYFFGEVLEIVVLSATAGTYISAAELKKVHSYLAIKYGITLEGQDLVASDGTTVVWDGTGSTNNGYKDNVFGIGKDSGSGLNQKQAYSFDRRAMTVFVDELKDLNSMNTGSIDEGHFLMFGSNDANEMTEYFYNKDTQFQNDITIEDVNFRQNQILKAQTTGQPSFTVNLKPHVSARYILVSDNPAFDPATTRIYHVLDGEAKDVLINNGEYIGFATYAIAPGGVVNGLRMWLNASNNITTDSNGDVSKWVDRHAGKTYQYMAASTYNKRPGYGCDPQMNFHPAVKFRQEGEYLSSYDGVMDEASPDNYTFFSVINNNFGRSDRSYFMGFGNIRPGGGSSRRPAFGVRDETIGGVNGGIGRFYEYGGTGSNQGNKILFKKNATTIAYHQIARQTAIRPQAFIRYEFDGYENIINDSDDLGGGSLLNGTSMVGVGSERARNMIGVMGEIFAYERELSQPEKNKVYSYLGLKYGITLDLNKSSSAVNYDYELSDGTIVWNGNATSHQKYHNNVAALVKDDYMNLNNMQAHSTDLGQIIHMGIGTKLGCDPDLTGFPADVDKAAIVWGHDNTTLTQEVDFTGNEEICGAIDKKISRVWLVQKTGIEKQAVMITPDGEDFPYSGAGYQLFLLVADSEDKLVANAWDKAVPSTYVNGQQVINYTFTDEFTYFSIGVKALPGTCEGCDFEGTKNLDFSTWTRGGLSKVYDLGDNFTATVAASIASPGQWVSRYPRASSQRSLREYRRTNAQALMKTSISFTETAAPTVKQAAAAKFDVFEIDYRSGKYDKVRVYGKCDGEEVPARLSYVAAANRSSYEIRGSYAIAKRRPTSSYTATRGKLHVEFDYPVQEVIVEHTATGRVTGNKRLGIGPMQFTCPQPLPPVNEDGLIFTKEAPSEVLVCQEVTYTFNIHNTNCSPKPVNFSDILDDGMIWVSGGLSVDDAAISSATINEYAGARELKIDNLMVPGSSMLSFRATAVFKDDAVAPKVYENQAVLEYKRIVDSGEVDADPLYSCDRLTAGCEKTKVNALPVSNRPKRVEVKEFKVDNSCYKEDKTYTVTITLNNPNDDAIVNSLLDIGFNEEFTYVNNSLKSTPGTVLSGATIDASMEGLLFVEGFSVPSGQSTFTFEIKSPAKTALVQATDIDGNLLVDQNGDPVWVSLDVDFDFSNESSDICQDAIFIEANGAKELPYCSTKDCVISNKNVTPVIKR